MTYGTRLRAFTVAAVLAATAAAGAGRAEAATLTDAVQEAPRQIRLVAASMPDVPAPSDAFVRAQQAEIVTFWAQLGIVVLPDADIERVRLAENNDRYDVVTAAVGESAPGEVTVVVHWRITMACYASTDAALIVVNKGGDCAAHEYGHILGLGHSKAYLPGFGLSDYGNLYSVMGSGEGLPDYAQLEYLGMVGPAPYPAARFALRRNALNKSAVSWTQRDSRCYLELRGTSVVGYSTNDGRTTTISTILTRVGQERFMCGKWVELTARAGATALLAIE